MKFSTKLLILVLEASIIPILFGIYISSFNLHEKIVENVLTKLDAVAQIQKNRILENARHEKELIELFTSKPEITSLLSDYNNTGSASTQDALVDNLKLTMRGSSIITELTIADTRGVIVATTDESNIGKSISKADYFAEGLKKINIDFVQKNPKTGQIGRYSVGPLKLNAKTIGVGVFVTSDDDLLSIANDYTGLGKTGETLIATENINGDTRFILPTRFNKNENLDFTLSKTQTRVPAVNAVAGQEKFFVNAIDYRGVPVIAATRYIPELKWGIVVKIDKSEALSPVAYAQISFAFILLVIISAISVVIIPTTRSLTRPIAKLTDAAKKIANGDLSQSLTIKSKDEIGNLSNYLNKMVIGLKQANEKYKTLSQNLGKEVKLKTSRLENQNIFLSEANKAMLNLSEDLEQEKNNLEISKTHNDAVLAGMGDALIAVDGAGVITIINPAAEIMFGYTPAEIVGKSIFDAILMENEKGEVIPSDKRPLTQSFWEGRVVKATYICTKKDGTKFTSAITSSPIILGKKAIGAVDVFRDVTKESAIDKAKTEFVSLASHQLRTPATAVKWYSEMLLDKKLGKLSEKQSKYLEEVYHGNERMIKLIDNLLSVSRIELGKMSPKIENVNVKKLLDDVVKEQSSEIKVRKHKIIVDKDGDLPAVQTDPILVRMILQNFLSNAIKYTPNKGQIECALEKKGPKMIFSIKDNGVGIPRNEQKRIFEKLFRASTALPMDKEGNGLGLYIVRQVAESLKGRVWFESDEGKGTTFYLELPIKNNV